MTHSPNHPEAQDTLAEQVASANNHVHLAEQIDRSSTPSAYPKVPNCDQIVGPDSALIGNPDPRSAGQ